MRVTTDEQIEFITFFRAYALPRLNDKKVRNDARLAFHSAMNDKLLGVRRVMSFLDIPCDFEDEIIEPFVEAIYMHLLNGQKTREKISKEEKTRLFDDANHQCPLCKKEFEDVNKVETDHKIPFSLVFDTITNNIQCLCPSCNRKKGDQIINPSALTIRLERKTNAYRKIAANATYREIA